MMIFRLSFFFGCFLCLSFLGNEGKAQDSEERLQHLIGVLESNVHLRAPVRIRFHRTQIDHVPVSGPGHIKGEKPGQRPYHYETSYFISEMALKDERSYLKESTATNPNEVESITNSATWVFDGKNTFEHLDNRFAVSSRREEKGGITPWVVTGDRSILDTLLYPQQALEKPHGFTRTITDEIGPRNEPLVKLVIEKQDHTSSLTVLFQPNLNYAILKAEQINNGKLLVVNDQCTYQYVGGKVYPKTARKTAYKTGPDGKTRQVRVQYDLVVDSIDTDPNNIPDSLFEMEIPKNTPIYDRDTQTRLYDPKAIQNHLARLAEQVPGKKAKPWWPNAVALGSLTLVAVVVGFYIIRRRRAARKI